MRILSFQDRIMRSRIMIINTYISSNIHYLGTGSKCGFILKTYEEGDWIFKLSTDKEEYANCGIHLHDYISSRDMFHYFTLSATYEGNEVKVSGTLSWWVKYFPEDWVKSITDADNFVEYNIGDYVCKL